MNVHYEGTFEWRCMCVEGLHHTMVSGNAERHSLYSVATL